MGNPNDHGGYYFVEYEYNPGTRICNRTKGSFRHYIHYFLQGSAVYYTEQGSFSVSTGDLIYLPMDIQYTGQFQDTHILSCGFTHFPEALEHTYLPQKLPDKFIPEFMDIPKNIMPDSATLGKFYSLLSQLLPHLKEADVGYTKSLAEKIRIFIWRNYKCQVKDIAHYCKMSVANLYRVLKKNGYETPNQLKNEVLIQKAMLWLADTDNSVERISDELGFSNTNYFRKVFKAHTGKSPRTYRQDASKPTLFIE